ncbi:sulfatase [Luteolibacter sp. Populi]|uniref:sulfatase family protein n=1 Tax=Luteolibacter sp. Populi TaxID=3230487 RepID=UPI003466AEB9
MKILLVLLAAALPCLAEDKRPNILWITSEDNASHWLGCYGNKDASTPRLDELAGAGVKFTRAYSNAPVCAVARSTILNGTYAVSQGTQHMRSRPRIPASFKPYVAYLREQGYHCTNNSKTDYNFKGDDAALWDASSGKAHYKDRPDGKPFMAVFNLTVTHESNLFPAQVGKNRRNDVIPATPRLSSADLTLPPYQPDLPEFRSDTAIYHDCISAMDRQVGKLLDELQALGLADDTIVFYYSDHGGAMARGKRYLQDTGTRVPLIVRFPEKWQHLSPVKPGSEVAELVSFVDLAPTLLSLCGIETPGQMQGRPFLGKHRATAKPEVFLFADRFDDTPGMRRGITDGRFKYIRCFTPHLPGAPYSSYALGQPSWKAWQEAWQNGKLEGGFKNLWEPGQPVESLFDTQSDPWEVTDIASQPEQAGRLAAMRERLKALMIETRDTGVVPEAMWADLIKGGTIHDAVRADGFDQAKLVELAFLATTPGEALPTPLMEALESPLPAERHWAELGKRLKELGR